jgi:ornithine cyclodeaminase/alanine dehydrogenase-like protein (mu-crystallin family)
MGQQARPSVLSLSAGEVVAALEPAACVAAVERAFRLLGEGHLEPPAVCGVHAEGGVFHVKAALLPDEEGRPFFAAKVNANFPGNPRRHGLPTIQGAVLLLDGARGTPLAILDSPALTACRTAAATAVAARWLARPGSTRLALLGCGVQGLTHLAYLTAVLPLRTVWLADPDPAAVGRCAREAARLGLEARAAADPRAACRESDVCVTCTPGREVLLGASDVAPGAFVAAVGADNESKQELDPALLRRATLVADLREQCARMGDLHHAIAGGALSLADVHADLGEVVAGRRPGRATAEEVIVFDSTGLAIQDVAAALVACRAALAADRGVRVDLAS